MGVVSRRKVYIEEMPSRRNKDVVETCLRNDQSKKRQLEERTCRRNQWKKRLDKENTSLGNHQKNKDVKESERMLTEHEVVKVLRCEVGHLELLMKSLNM